jgi:DNA-binding response OmpR family regulator
VRRRAVSGISTVQGQVAEIARHGSVTVRLQSDRATVTVIRHLERVSPDDTQPPHATIVAAVPSSDADALAIELRRDALQIEIGTADVLRNSATSMVYVFWFDAALGVVLADRIVAWANDSEPRAGLIGVVEDGGTGDREALLASGFDDVVAGALSPRELGARIRAVHRRMFWSGSQQGRLRYGAFTLDLRDHALCTEGRMISLTSIELAVMRELIKARGRLLSRAELLDAAWGGNDLEISERAVDNVILRLRRKLPQPDAIQTVRSVGFRIAP